MKQKLWSKDILLLMAASFFYMASPMLVTPLITGFSETLGAGAMTMGLVGGLTNLCSLVCQPFSGNLADKMSKYRLSTIGTALLVVACLGYVASVNPIMILFFRIVNGLGFACCSVCFSTWISNLLPKEKIGFGMGVYGMMNAFAMALAPAIGVAVYQNFGYRWAFVCAILFAALSFLMIQLTTDKGLPFPDANKKKAPFKLMEKNVIPFALVIMCFAIPYCATQSFLVRYTETRQIPIMVSLFFTLYAAALLILRVVFRNLFDRLAFVKFFAASSISSLAAMFFLFHMENHIEMALAAFFLAGGYGIMCTVCQSSSVLAAKPENRGLANGTYYIGLNSGMALGPMIGGALYGSVPIELFYPLLMSTVPLGILLYFGSKQVLRLNRK